MWAIGDFEVLAQIVDSLINPPLLEYIPLVSGYLAAP